jgi:hypothetical protein
VALAELDGVTGKTGWFETSKYADGTPVAYVAAIQELGAVLRPDPEGPSAADWMDTEGPAGGFIPPRHSAEWMTLLGEGAAALLRGKKGLTAIDVMEQVAKRAAFDVAKQIAAVNAPPLAASTIARKGHSKPLLETGKLGQDVTGIAERTTK